MFATVGTIKRISKVESGKKLYYALELEKNRKGDKYKLLFFIFNDKLIEDIKSDKFVVGNSVEITFYIKGNEKNNIIRNNLFASEITLLNRRKLERE